MHETGRTLWSAVQRDPEQSIVSDRACSPREDDDCIGITHRFFEVLFNRQMKVLGAPAEAALRVIEQEAGGDFKIVQPMETACARVADEKAVQQLLRGRRNLKLFQKK